MWKRLLSVNLVVKRSFSTPNRFLTASRFSFKRQQKPWFTFPSIVRLAGASAVVFAVADFLNNPSRTFCEENSGELLNEQAAQYLNGIGVPVDYDKAFELFKLAVEAGETFAMYNLAYCYLNGIGCTKDEGKAVQYYELAAEKGMEEAMFKLGQIYSGEIIKDFPVDEKKAFDFFKLAAENGLASAQHRVGYRYYHGNGCEKDVPKALELYELAAAQDNLEAHHRLGYHYFYNGPNFQKAKKHLIRAATGEGNVKSQFLLARLYEEIEKDNVNARKYFEMSADQGFAPAQCKIGHMCTHGSGGKVDYQKALHYLELAVNQGYTDAHSFMGDMYMHGYGVKQDYNKAKMWYEGADSCMSTENNLGVIYLQGLGGKVDYKKSMEHFERAHKMGSATALSNIGALYLHGAGVPEDIPKALDIFQKASELGDNSGWFYMGNYCTENSEFTKAKEYLQKAIDLEEAQQLLAEITQLEQEVEEFG